MSLTTGPDADDHPHPAAAIYAQAHYLLTHDSRGFPVSPLREQGVTVTSVDDFLCGILAKQRDDVLDTVQSRARSLKQPPMTLERYLETLVSNRASARARSRASTCMPSSKSASS